MFIRESALIGAAVGWDIALDGRTLGLLTSGTYILHHYQSRRLSSYAKMLEPDYDKVRLLEIGVGRRFWQSKPSAKNARAFYVRVVKPLRRLQRRGVVERLQEIPAIDHRTPIAVEIIGPVDLTKASNSTGRP
jgi:hypothetical protein